MRTFLLFLGRKEERRKREKETEKKRKEQGKGDQEREGGRVHGFQLHHR